VEGIHAELIVGGGLEIVFHGVGVFAFLVEHLIVISDRAGKIRIVGKLDIDHQVVKLPGMRRAAVAVIPHVGQAVILLADEVGAQIDAGLQIPGSGIVYPHQHPGGGHVFAILTGIDIGSVIAAHDREVVFVVQPVVKFIPAGIDCQSSAIGLFDLDGQCFVGSGRQAQGSQRGHHQDKSLEYSHYSSLLLSHLWLQSQLRSSIRGLMRMRVAKKNRSVSSSKPPNRSSISGSTSTVSSL